ncbi:MAG: putative lipopolysaccharide heptosyltransferase III [Nitrospirae bacterium]|nr:putative lipopolysaccharide heptosyltransferase III [Nitrospirota bacterium]
MTRLLVIKLRHIGDVLLTTPVYRVIRENVPDAHIAVMVNSGTEPMLSENPNIDELIVFDRSIKGQPFLKKCGSELSFLRGVRAGGFDTTVDLTGGDRGAIASYVSGATRRIGRNTHKVSLWGKKALYTDLIGVDHTQHVVSQNLRLVTGLLGNDVQAPVRVEMHVPEAETHTAEAALKSSGVHQGDTLVHIHPMSRWQYKCWQDDYMADVITWLVANGVKVVLTAAPDARERERVERIVSLTALSAASRAGGLISLGGAITLKALAAISRRCALFFGVDSAPMHIAAAVDTPVVALFGPSGVFNWGPWYNDATTLQPYPQRNGPQTCGIHSVIQRDWPCIPCGKDGCNGSKKSDCLDDITPSEVKHALTKALNRNRP